MNKYNRNFLQKVFYLYWMERVPELEEIEAIDHLWFDILCSGWSQPTGKDRLDKKDKKRLKKFLKEKGIKFDI